MESRAFGSPKRAVNAMTYAAKKCGRENYPSYSHPTISRTLFIQHNKAWKSEKEALWSF